ncbi:efflux RND transporter periplasmic adaptor subunit [Bradyrhizobium prioriisuperbiae]|uniref:efflux RND transporter periplasmic adaptor subunit n=1 Tax=Bradyrhizobium prioriisuperbiae TaxID=2854389 RepID=UPI0028EDB977|nr:efflux RND transporter periplasmic adaptor subunit [Bradyrhizobium prioritasuperba]
MPPEQPASAISGRKLSIVGVVVGIGLIVVVVTGIVAREKGDAHLREWTETQSIPTVAVAPPGSKTLTPALNLPGRLEAYSRAPIFARVSGYVTSWKVDIGARVKSGDLLAEIEAPDLDQQLLQARADLANAQAAAKLSEATLKRRQTLLTQNFASQQDVDERTADLNSKNALVKSGQANVDRLEALAAYKRLTAPFDGIVTARDTDVGALINAGNGGAAMFVISDIKKLRVYVNVPQNYVPSIKIGTKGSITVPEYPERAFQAVVESSSQAVDVSSGTTRMQLGVENDKGELLPGSYSNVRLDLSRDVQPLHIPASALIFDQNGLRVATVGANDRVLFKKVTIARDLGREIEIATGLAADDRVILTPPDGLADNDQVRIAGAPQRKNVPTASAAQDGKS